MAGAMVEVTEAMPVRRGFLNGLARFQSKAHFPCPICGGRAVRALSDTHGRADVGDFYCLDHKEPFRAPLMQPNEGGTVNKDQEIIALEIEKQLREKQESGGGCIYLSCSEWAERLEVSEGEFLRQFAELVDAGRVKPSVIEICG
jgi:hypothetical protein